MEWLNHLKMISGFHLCSLKIIQSKSQQSQENTKAIYLLVDDERFSFKNNL